jgi:hypothetical protein
VSQICPFHSDEWSKGVKQPGGSIVHRCERASGHRHPGPLEWLEVPEPAGVGAGASLASELGLDLDLPSVISGLGKGWWEYGLVERAYAQAHPEQWAFMVEKWGHTALASTPYTASAYLGRTLADLSRTGSLLFHLGPATGRWSYNSPASYWSLWPEPDWQQRTSWVSVVDDQGVAPRDPQDRCREYVPGA